MNSWMNRRTFMQWVAASAASTMLTPCHGNGSESSGKRRKPNIVIIFLDDSGWSDFEPFGRHAYKTPNVEQLAGEGCRFTNFYVPQAVCSASRAALLSGCYPCRTKVFGAHGPKGAGLDPKYAILSEVFKADGYRTAIFGKWHIGDQDGRRPWDRGFDQSCGLLYSNNMWEHHPENPDYWGKYPLQYFENGKVKIPRVTKEDQPHLTTWYTEKAVDFIRQKKDNAFFLYVPHSMPHVPLFVSEKFAGKSGAGLYGDVMMEIDWSVGQITGALKENGLDDDTIVIFSSDNGPWISYGNHAGQTPFREAKGTGFDGGIRSACIIKYPGRIRPGTIRDRMFCTVDLLPTLAHVTGSTLPDNEIDGKNVWGLIAGETGSVNPHDYYPFSTGSVFEGVISGDGRWKLHLPHTYQTLVKPGHDGSAGKYKQETIGLSLFDMNNDPNETKDVKDQFPEVLARLQGYADRHKKLFYSQTQ
jgi:arylsulfatase A